MWSVQEEGIVDIKKSRSIDPVRMSTLHVCDQGSDKERFFEAVSKHGKGYDYDDADFNEDYPDNDYHDEYHDEYQYLHFD